MPVLRTCSFVLVVAVLVAAATNCGDGYTHATFWGNYPQGKVHVLYDSPEVQRMVREGIAADILAKQPGFDVAQQAHFKILVEADSFPYSKVAFDDGPFKGQVGWVWRGSIDDPRTRML
jgi:hypothetical protein